jgi:hypothetical protein
MLNKPLKHFHISDLPMAGRVYFAVAGFERRPVPRRSTTAEASTVLKFPRPDASVLNETIPLYYIGQNKNRFWVTREAQGRSGGLFLFKRSAQRFARKKSAPAGCALMILTEPLELDLENQGSRLAESLMAAIDVATRRAPTCVAFINAAIGKWRRLAAQISHALAGERRHRDAIERELFHGQYTLTSKNDDDLPIG